jgi:AraC-like DNA-binding protein
MIYQCIPPPASLHAFVKCFWIFESNADAKAYTYRSMADGCAELIFHYKGVFREPGSNGGNFYAGLQAPTKQFKRYITYEPFGIFGVYLYPYAIPYLFRLSVSSLTDEMPDLQTLLAKTGKELEEKMITAGSNAARLQILTAFLEKKLLNRYEEKRSSFAAIRHLIDSGSQVSVPSLSEKFCMTERTLQRQFKEFAGLSPKLLSRITRFKASLNDYGNRKKLLTEIALECGYYDQSHFIADFKSFSGYHPRSWFHGNPEGAEWREA